MSEVLLTTYTVVKYEQIWSVDLWLENTDVAAVVRVFEQFPQIQWLIDQGYRPTVHKWHNIASQNMHLLYEFSVRDQDLTFMLLHFPQSEITIDYDNMTTYEETING